MRLRHFYIPFELRHVTGMRYLWAKLNVQFRRADGSFVGAPAAVFDTAAGFTTLPAAWAKRTGIECPDDAAPATRVTSSTGVGLARFGEATFAFRDLPGWSFTSTCAFSATAPYPLLALGDMVRNFHMSTTPETREHPVGAFLLRLRADHEGEPRR